MHTEAISADLSSVKRAVDKLAYGIGASEQSLPTYGRSEDGARPHIEVAGQTYHYVVVERGRELKRKTTKEIDELLYWVFSSVVFDMAFKYELEHRVEGQDCRRIGFAKQIEILRTMSESWADRRKQEIEKILTEHPFSDKLP